VAGPKREEERVIPINGGSVDESASSEVVAGGDAAVDSEVAKIRAELDELQQTLIRRQADFENYRKRVERDRHEEGRRGVERLMMDLIPVLDGFDRALKAHEDPAYEEYRAGAKLIRKQLWDAMARHGVERIEATGKMFDPHVHQAVERVESTNLPDGSVAEVYQDGYMFHGRVLRPAMVKVAVHPSESSN
jgi:molecular chaperone GrpE